MRSVRILVMLGLLALPVCADTIFLKNGNVMTGEIVHEDASTVVLKTAYGSVTLHKKQIRSIKRGPVAKRVAPKRTVKKTTAARRKSTPKVTRTVKAPASKRGCNTGSKSKSKSKSKSTARRRR